MKATLTTEEDATDFLERVAEDHPDILSGSYYGARGFVAVRASRFGTVGDGEKIEFDWPELIGKYKDQNTATRVGRLLNEQRGRTFDIRPNGKAVRITVVKKDSTGKSNRSAEYTFKVVPMTTENDEM
ncbi:MAG: hypothetical protein R3D68_07065 [Hyphomicrobiaceae bacterium]